MIKRREIFYGKICKHGHDHWNGQSLRYKIKTKPCVECLKAAIRKYKDKFLLEHGIKSQIYYTRKRREALKKLRGVSS